MSDAWIYSSGSATDELVRSLAELGFSPRRVRPTDPGVPTGLNGAAARPPVLAVIAAGREDPAPTALCAEVKAREELVDVPLLLALEPEHLRSAPELGGADELLVPPYSFAELRVRVARARRGSWTEDETTDDIVQVGSLAINPTTYQVTIDDDAVRFTYMEYELLKFLVMHPRRVFSREALLTRVWGYDYYGSGRTVDVHIRRLRAKLGEHAARIKTVRSVGYLFDSAAEVVGVAV